jgi:uroporphyrinogen-III synthase
MSVAEVTGPLLHLAGRHRRGDVAAQLTAKGIVTDVHTLYDQQLCDLTEEAQALLAGDKPVLVPLFSPRSAQQFVAQARKLRHVTVVAISGAVAQALGKQEGVEIKIAAAPTGAEMVRSVENLLQGPSVP